MAWEKSVKFDPNLNRIFCYFNVVIGSAQNGVVGHEMGDQHSAILSFRISQSNSGAVGGMSAKIEEANI